MNNSILTRKFNPKWLKYIDKLIIGLGIALLIVVVGSIMYSKMVEHSDKKLVESKFEKISLPSSLETYDQSWTRVGFGEPLYWRQNFISHEKLAIVAQGIKDAFEEAGYTANPGDCFGPEDVECHGRAYNTSDGIEVGIHIFSPDFRFSPETRSDPVDYETALKITLEIEKSDV